MTISISISAILREIYALTALRAHQSRQHLAERPRLLTRDNENALRPIVSDALTTVICAMSRWVTGTNHTALEPPETVTIDLDVTPAGETTAHLLRRSIEHAVVHDTLAIVWADSNADVADTHRTRSAASVDKLVRDLTRTSYRPTTIRACRY